MFKTFIAAAAIAAFVTTASASAQTPDLQQNGDTRYEWVLKNCKQNWLNQDDRAVDTRWYNDISTERWERIRASCADGNKRLDAYRRKTDPTYRPAAQQTGYRPQPWQTRSAAVRESDDEDEGVVQQGRRHCPRLGSREFFMASPRPQGDGWFMVERVPGKPCGGWARHRRQ